MNPGVGMISGSLARALPFRRAEDPRRRVLITYAVLTVLLAGYLVSLLVRSPQDTNIWLDGWGICAFEAVASTLCVLRVFSIRRGRVVPLVLGLALLAWTLGDIALTIESLHGATPPVPSLADAFYLSFYPLTYVAVLIFLRSRVRGLAVSSWLDGLVAGLGAASVCAMFLFHGLLKAAGGHALAVATNLAYPTGDLLLLVLVVGGTALLSSDERRAPWLLLAAGAAINVVGDTFNLFSSTPVGASRVGVVFNAIAWPAAILAMSFSVWLRPARRSPFRTYRQIGFLLPGLAFVAGLVILLIGAVRPHPAKVAVGLAAATLAVVGVRLVLTVWELRRITEHRRRQAITDELTGLGNRRYLFTLLDDFFADQIEADPSLPPRRLAFLFVDLNHFKQINDSFGHPAGDQLLQQLGPRVLAHLRPGDTPVRLGGDEFGIVLLDADAEEAKGVARRLAQALTEAFELGPVRATVGASIGIALAPSDAVDSAGLVWCADVAMYRAKVAGAPFALYDADIDNDGNRWRMVEELRRGLDEGQLVMHYQPQVQLKSGRVLAVEALVRWIHPVHGVIPPLKFLPLAEEGGMMDQLTEWVLDEAIGQCARWRMNGQDLAVSVNVSPSTLLSPGFSETVLATLARHELSPNALVLEITETSIISDFDGSRAVIDELVASGVTVSIDDFGAGFTSLAHLSALAVRELKLDRAFITGLAGKGRERDLQLVRSTIELGHALGLRVVAEGVEDSATLALLGELGCDVAQGYYVSRPKPARELAIRAGEADSPGLPAAAPAGSSVTPPE